MRQTEEDLMLYGRNANDTSIRNAGFRIPKKCIDGVWYGDLDVMREMMIALVRSAEQSNNNKAISCDEFDSIAKRVLAKREQKH